MTVITKDYRRLDELPPSVQDLGNEIAEQVEVIDGLPKHIAIEDVVNSYYYDKPQWKAYNNRRNDLITIARRKEKTSSVLAKKIQSRSREHIFGGEEKEVFGEEVFKKTTFHRSGFLMISGSTSNGFGWPWNQISLLLPPGDRLEI